MISIEYVRTVEDECVRLSRRRQLPLWVLVAILLPYFTVAAVEHYHPRVEAFVPGEMR